MLQYVEKKEYILDGKNVLDDLSYFRWNSHSDFMEYKKMKQVEYDLIETNY